MASGTSTDTGEPIHSKCTAAPRQRSWVQIMQQIMNCLPTSRLRLRQYTPLQLVLHQLLLLAANKRSIHQPYQTHQMSLKQSTYPLQNGYTKVCKVSVFLWIFYWHQLLDPTTNPTQTSKTPSLANEIEEAGPDGILKDIEVVDIDKLIKVSHEARSRDINELFSAPYVKDGKKVRNCDACTYVFSFLLYIVLLSNCCHWLSKSKKKPVPIVNKATTLRCHQEALHKVGSYLISFPVHINLSL